MQPIEVNSCGECPWSLCDKETGEIYCEAPKTFNKPLDNLYIVHPSCPINKGEPFTIIFEPKK
jgi:hypothetical protein